MTAITSSAASETERARKAQRPAGSRCLCRDDRVAAPVRKVNIEEDDVRVELLDGRVQQPVPFRPGLPAALRGVTPSRPGGSQRLGRGPRRRCVLA